MAFEKGQRKEEIAQQQFARVGDTEGVVFIGAAQALDNGFLSVADAARTQDICDRLDADRINAFFRKWLARLPHPFSGEDRAAGYRYNLSILQPPPRSSTGLWPAASSSTRSSETTSTRADPKEDRDARQQGQGRRSAGWTWPSSQNDSRSWENPGPALLEPDPAHAHLRAQGITARDP